MIDVNPYLLNPNCKLLTVQDLYDIYPEWDGDNDGGSVCNVDPLLPEWVRIGYIHDPQYFVFISIKSFVESFSEVDILAIRDRMVERELQATNESYMEFYHDVCMPILQRIIPEIKFKILYVNAFDIILNEAFDGSYHTDRVHSLIK